MPKFWITALLLLTVGLPLAAQDAVEEALCQPLIEAKEQAIRVAVLFSESESGSRHLDGILEAHEASKSSAALFSCAYRDEAEGSAALRGILEDAEYHLVLGPTDSGVYLEAAEDREAIRQAHTPIISALVTAPVANRHDGWIFRTNVRIESRAGELFDHLDESGFEHIAVIYSDSTFGRSAETALRNEFENDPAKKYEAYRFNTEADLRLARRKIEAGRPGALGIFAPRNQIEGIFDGLRSVQSRWNAYKPLLFSIVDTRTLDLEGIQFASLVRASPGHRESLAESGGETEKSSNAERLRKDEVYGLGYDTASIVFRLIAESRTLSNREQWQRDFRKRFSSSIQQGFQRHPGNMTRMRFRDRENHAQPQILMVADGSVRLAPFHRDLGPVLGLLGKLDVRILQWIDILDRRYGYAPWIAVLLVACLSAALSIADLRNWQGGRSRSMVAQFPFVALIVFNVLTATVLFAVLASTGHFRWDSLGAALLVGLGYAALLKSTVFKSATGESYGIETLYNRLVGWINDRVMVAKYQREIAAIKFIAYTNSKKTLETTLRGIYTFARTPERHRQLTAALTEELNKRGGHELEQRIFLAQELKVHWNWKRLQERRFVPVDLLEARMVDPDHIIRDSCAYVFGRNPEEALKQVRTKVEEHLANLEEESPELVQEAKEGLMSDLALTDTTMQRVEGYIRWLFIQYGFKLEPIRKSGLAQPSLEWDDLLPSFFERTSDWGAWHVGRLLRGVRRLRGSP